MNDGHLLVDIYTAGLATLDVDTSMRPQNLRRLNFGDTRFCVDALCYDNIFSTTFYGIDIFGDYAFATLFGQKLVLNIHDISNIKPVGFIPDGKLLSGNQLVKTGASNLELYKIDYSKALPTQ